MPKATKKMPFESPNCEIITIGTELLLGQILDTNTTYLAQELGRIGISVHFRTAVGDLPDEMAQVIEGAVKRCDMVMITGGLGPTKDDLTRDVVAKIAGVDPEFRKDLMAQIEQVFNRYAYNMPENNRRQAFVPAGSQAIPNPVGTAPAFIKEVRGKPIICLPGVPRELKYLLNGEVIPWLRKRFHLTDQRIIYRVLKTVGISESRVDQLVGDLMGQGKNPEVGLLASQGEIKIRIAAKAKNKQSVDDLIRPIEQEIRSRLGNKIFGRDDDTLEQVIDSMLTDRDLTLAIFETFTAGRAAQRLHGLTSHRLLESCVIPDKKNLLKWMDKGDCVIGSEAALSIARKISIMAHTDIGLAVLGFLDKKDEEYKIKGYAGVAGKGIEKTFSWDMGGDVITIQVRGSMIGLNTLRLALIENMSE
jgi:nicotinamide-nucleotide amidase